MTPNRQDLINHIAHYAATGQIRDELVPFYDQDGKWCGAPVLWCRNSIFLPQLELIKSSCLPSSRRTLKTRHGTVLRTSFVWRGNESIDLIYSGILGSLVAEGNGTIHAASLRHVGGCLVSSTNKKVYLPNLREVGLNFQLMKTFDLQVPRLRYIGGRAQLLGRFPPQLETVGKSLGVYWCFNAESGRLRRVGDYLALSKAEAIRLPALEGIGGSLLLTLLVMSIDVPRLESIGGDFLAPCAERIRARRLRSIGGKVDTSSAKGFYNPRIRIGGAWTTYPGDVEQWARNEAARKAIKREEILL